jgi:Tol biopolymer transport system component
VVFALVAGALALQGSAEQDVRTGPAGRPSIGATTVPDVGGARTPGTTVPGDRSAPRADAQPVAGASRAPSRSSAPAVARYGILVMRGSRGMDPSSLVLLDFDGRNELDLESTATQTCRPTWSPDGERLAYCRDAVVEDQDVSRQPDYQEVVVRPVSGVGRRVLAIGKNPNFAPDGESVVFSADKHLWAVSVDGSGRRQLTTGSGTEDFPAWSPDGRHLAYVGTTSTLRAVDADDLATAIFIANADGSNPRLVAEALNTAFDWAPDGDSLVYTCPQGVCVVDASGGTPARLAESGHSPDWSSDGAFIAFARGDNPGQGTWGRTTVANGSVWVMRSDGTDQRQVTTESARTYRFPVFEPVR